mmetsp:Transcript_69875/g.191709  ORF Transcript_69875/g.191709 Transcript_69875/m.191709 type:complete len:398 (+) Transcript_69875:329-1522(+)
MGSCRPSTAVAYVPTARRRLPRDVRRVALQSGFGCRRASAGACRCAALLLNRPPPGGAQHGAASLDPRCGQLGLPPLRSPVPADVPHEAVSPPPARHRGRAARVGKRAEHVLAEQLPQARGEVRPAREARVAPLPRPAYDSRPHPGGGTRGSPDRPVHHWPWWQLWIRLGVACPPTRSRRERAGRRRLPCRARRSRRLRQRLGLTLLRRARCLWWRRRHIAPEVARPLERSKGALREGIGAHVAGEQPVRRSATEGDRSPPAAALGAWHLEGHLEQQLAQEARVLGRADVRSPVVGYLEDGVKKQLARHRRRALAVELPLGVRGGGHAAVVTFTRRASYERLVHPRPHQQVVSLLQQQVPLGAVLCCSGAQTVQGGAPPLLEDRSHGRVAPERHACL